VAIKDFADKYIQAELLAFQNNDFKTLFELESPDVVYHISPLHDLVGHEAHRQYILSVAAGVSGLTQKLIYLGGDVNMFLLSYKATGLITGVKPGFPPSIGKKMEMDYLMAVQTGNGKVLEVWANGIVYVN
jgi:hypothetical protein